MHYMREGIQLEMFVDEGGISNVDVAAFELGEKLRTISADLVYGDNRRDGLTYSFLERTDTDASILEQTATALTLMKSDFIEESDLTDYYRTSSLVSLKRSLISLEKIAAPDNVSEEDLDVIWTVSKLVADELIWRDNKSFVDKYYTGAGFYADPA